MLSVITTHKENNNNNKEGGRELWDVMNMSRA